MCRVLVTVMRVQAGQLLSFKNWPWSPGRGSLVGNVIVLDVVRRQFEPYLTIVVWPGMLIH